MPLHSVRKIHNITHRRRVLEKTEHTIEANDVAVEATALGTGTGIVIAFVGFRPVPKVRRIWAADSTAEATRT